MTRGRLSKRMEFTLGLLSILTLLAAYTYLAHAQHVENPDDMTIPTWGQLATGVVTAVAVDERSGERWLLQDAEATGTRLALGLGFSVVGALVLGLLMGSIRWMEGLFGPPLSALSQVPPTAMLAVFFVLVGTDNSMYVAMIAFGVLPTLAQTIHLAVRDVPIELLQKAATLGASRAEIIWDVVLKYTLPRIIDAVRLQVGPALIFLIAAEMVSADVGFGYRIRLQSRLLTMNVVYPYLAVLGTFGFLMNRVLRALQHVLCPWYTSHPGL